MSEDFNALTTGELNGQTGSNSISGSWAAVESISEVVDLSSDMVVTNAAGETFTGSGKALEITGNNNSAILGNLSTSVTSDFYVSMIVRMSAGDIGINDFATVWFGEGTHIGSPAIGLKTNVGPNGTDIMGRISGNQEVYASTDLRIGTSYLLVAKISKASSTTYNQLEFWLNPPSLSEPTPIGVSTGTIAFEDFDSLGIRSVNLDSDDIVQFDNIRIGTEWSDVVIADAIPEPHSLLLLAISSLSLLFRRAR